MKDVFVVKIVDNDGSREFHAEFHMEMPTIDVADTFCHAFNGLVNAIHTTAKAIAARHGSKAGNTFIKMSTRSLQVDEHKSEVRFE